jgi:hypothetical protein
MTLDLDLPEPPPRREAKALAYATFLSALAAVALLVVLLLKVPGQDAPAAGIGADRALAELLEKRTLWREAAALWEDLAENGEDLFRAGKCRMLAGEPERAARDLLAAEAHGLPAALSGESSRLVLEAYAMLGKFDVRNQALRRRTGDGGGEEAPVVARVGEEAITRDDLRTTVRDEEIARLLATGHLDREALDQAVSARSADPRQLGPILARQLTTRALALEALARGLGESPVLARRLRDIRHQLLANLLVEDRLLEGIRVSEEDLQDYYQAHPEPYTAPPAARFSFGEQQDALTEAEGWHEQGGAFPEGLPRSAEADALLFALEAGAVSDRAVRVGDRDLYLRLLERRPARLRPFAEVREQVTRDLYARRRDAAIQSLQDEVRAAHPFQILDPALKQALGEGEAGGR